MPDAAYWSTFFDAGAVIDLLGVAARGNEDVAEFGSGYGTFTFPAARRTTGVVYALDIEATLTESLQAQAARQGLANVHAIRRDFVADGTGLPDASVDHAMIYNLLHIEEPVLLLREALRILTPGGTASVIHWRSDIETPRGPSAEIRPTAAMCVAWALEAGFMRAAPHDISACARWHYGLVLEKPVG